MKPNSSARSRNLLSNGEIFDLLNPITSSMVGTSPCKGRATTKGSKRIFHINSRTNVKPPVEEATSDIPADNVSAS